MSPSRCLSPRLFLYLLLTLPMVIPSVAEAALTAPTVTERQIAKTVVFYLERQHISRQAVDDEISARTLDSFLKTLDPLKLFFMQSDIEEFSAQKTQLDDMLKKGDINAAHRIFQRFLQRVDERIAVALKQVDAPHDFTIDEERVREMDAAI